MTTLQTVTFDTYLGSIKDSIAKRSIIDLNTVPIRIRHDYAKRNRNITSGQALCPSCDGTGNMLFFCHKPCEGCEGTGTIDDTK